MPAYFALAALPFLLGLSVTWRLVWPWWKIPGKAVFYFGATLLLHRFGAWGLIALYVHQLLGLGFHIRFCRRHGFTWYAVEDPGRYVELSKATVARLRGPNQAMQCEGERVTVEWSAPLEEDP